MELKLYHETEDSRSLLALHFEEDRLSYYDKNENLIFKSTYASINKIRLERYDFNLNIDVYTLEANIELTYLEFVDDMFDRISAFLESYASDKCQFKDYH